VIRILILTVGLFLLLPATAHADCTGPTGVESQTQYDFTAHTLNLCDGTNWLNLGGGSGTGVTDGDKGDLTVSASGATWMLDDDVLNFTELSDTLTLDASTEIAASGTNALSITNSGTGPSLRVNDDTSSDTTPFVIDAAGNVGIGTSTPTRSVHIDQNQNTGTGVAIENGNTGTAARSNLTFLSDSVGFDLFAASSTFAGSYGAVPVAGAAVLRSFSTVGAQPTSMIIGTGAANPLHLMTTNAPRISIDGTGNVTIGSTTPYQTDGAISPRVQVHGPSATTSALSSTAWVASAASPGSLVLGKSKSGTVGTNAIVADNDALGGIYFNGDDGTGFKRSAYIESRVNDMPGDLRFATTADGAATPTERMRITSDGNVGIGTTSPSQKLHLVGTGTEDGIRIVLADTNNVLLGYATGGTNMTHNLYTSGSTGILALHAANAEQVRLSSSGSSFLNGGNVGIGTASPQYLLHLNANSPLIGLTNAAAGVGNIGFYEGSTIKGYVQYVSPTHAVGAPRTGNLEIATPSAAPEDIDIRPGDVSAIYINNGGNVGIGTTSPASKLETVGIILAGDVTAANGSTGFAIRYDGAAGNLLNTLGSMYSSAATVLGYGVKPRNNAAGLVSSAGNASFSKGALQVSNALTFSNAPAATVAVGTVVAMTDRFVIDSSGNMVISGSSAQKATGTTWSNPSDIRLKDVDGPYQQGLASILKLETVRFHFKRGNPRNLPSNKEVVGLIAQDVQKVFPEAISREKDGYLTLDTSPINFATINAIKELKTANDNLRAEHDAELKALRTEIEALKAAR
jgi:trimeric autotransporter adhesin